MPRHFTPKVLTANHLLKGDVIYLGTDGDWTRDHAHARLFTDEAEADAALKQAELLHSFLVGAYLADAETGNDGPRPTHFREEFRATGPSNYAHGKQVELH